MSVRTIADDCWSKQHNQGDGVARKVFFSFHFQRDSWRVGPVRNSNVVRGYDKNPFFSDKAEWESIKRTTPGGIQAWIDKQLFGTSVTVVLIGAETANRPWVKYEIEQSIALGKALVGVHISGIQNQRKETDSLGMNPLPSEYPVYKWNHDGGAERLGKWIEAAALSQGRP
ncbi:TIR domain-containing protein [Nocardia sp. GCM10030253]|uniref:TIR domain-containing protein n=1 Tax=Nocardia sp. GCM10030253 TaxID=3273404 RepID=UPI00362AB83A